MQDVAVPQPDVTPATPADAAAVAEIVAALESSLYGSSPYAVADVEDEWADLDLARQTLAVRLGDRLVGYGDTRGTGELWRAAGCVHPSAHGRGVGLLLATRLEALARAGGARRLQHSVLEADTPGRDLLASLGYTPVRVFRELQVTLAGPPPEPAWPAGLRADAFDPERDARDFHAAHQEAFADHWEYAPRDFDRWAATHLSGDRFDPGMWCVVRDGSEIAAGTICTGATYGGGYVHALFTRRPWRQRGIGAALLADAFARCWSRGERTVGLNVDAASATGAFRLYERAGMTPLLGWVMLEKDLAAAG